MRNFIALDKNNRAVCCEIHVAYCVFWELINLFMAFIANFLESLILFTIFKSLYFDNNEA